MSVYHLTNGSDIYGSEDAFLEAKLYLVADLLQYTCTEQVLLFCQSQMSPRRHHHCYAIWIQPQLLAIIQSIMASRHLFCANASTLESNEN